MSKRSSNLPIWNFFDKSIDGIKTATCNYCHRELSFKTSVTNLKQHLKHRHIEAYNNLINLAKTHETSFVPQTDKQGGEVIEDRKTGPAHIEATNTSDETDASRSEEECSSQTFFKDSHGSLSWVKSKKSQYNPAELHQMKKRKHKETNIILRPVSHQMDKDEEDECDIFGKLIAKKMRKLSEDRKDAMMIKINKLFYEECYERNRLSSSSSF